MSTLINQNVLDALPRNVLERAFKTVNANMRRQGLPVGFPILGVLCVERKNLPIAVWKEIMRRRNMYVQKYVFNTKKLLELGFTPNEIKLIQADPFLTLGKMRFGKIKGLPLIGSGRTDFFPSGSGKHGFSSETNTGVPGGIWFKDNAHDQLEGTQLSKALRSAGYKRSYLVKSYVKAAKKYFDAWIKEHPKACKNIAVVDVEIGSAALTIAREMGEIVPSGVRVKTVAFKGNWTHRGGKLYVQGCEIGFILRLADVNVSMLTVNMDHPVTKSLLKNKVFSFPTVSGRVPGAKGSDVEVRRFWPSVILGKNPIPRTWGLTSINLRWAIRNRSRFVVKPALGDGGKDTFRGGAGVDVIFGSKVTSKEWGRLLRKALGSSRKYIIQRVFTVEPQRLWSVQGRKLAKYDVVTGFDPYFFGGKICGFAIRGTVYPDGYTGTPAPNNVMKGGAGVGLVYVK